MSHSSLLTPGTMLSTRDQDHRRGPSCRQNCMPHSGLLVRSVFDASNAGCSSGENWVQIPELALFGGECQTTDSLFLCVPLSRGLREGASPKC